MQYEGVVYRPPSEANSLIIQASIGCAHNKCSFCNMYRDKQFRIRGVEDIKKDIDWVKDNYAVEMVDSIFLADGNTILMRTPQLVEILEYARASFPYLERVTCYGASQYLARKPLDDFKKLREAGLTRIHCGMESGHDPLLKLINKGGTQATHIEGGKKVRAAGMELSMYYMPGLGGLQMWEGHAKDSAYVLNEVDPEFIRLRTFVPIAGTEIADDYQEGKFELMKPLEVIREIRLLLENLNVHSQFLSDHWTNFVNLRGKLPEDKERLLAEADEALAMPEDAFRKIGMTHGTL